MLIVDDVITAGTAIRESVEIIRAQGATPAGVLIALDREERGQGEKSAVQEVQDTFGLPVISVLRLRDLMAHLEASGDARRAAGRAGVPRPVRRLRPTAGLTQVTVLTRRRPEIVPVQPPQGAEFRP